MTHRHPPAAGAPTAPAEGALTQAAYVLFGIVAWTAFTILALLTLLLVVLTPGIERRRRVVHGGARLVLPLVGVQLEVRGLEHVPDGPCVVVANHASYLDGVVMKAALPPRFAYVVKREMASVPLAGLMLELIGTQFVERFDRHRGASDARRVLRTAHSGQALVFFPEIIQANIRAVIKQAGGVDRLRPHVKTHKTSEVVQMQLLAGVTKHKCATIAEAEMLAQVGVPEILIAYPIIGPNVRRVRELVAKYPKSRFAVLCDHPDSARGLDQGFADAPAKLNVFMDIDVGHHRTGIAAEPLRLPFWIEEQSFLIRDTPLYMAVTDRFNNGDPGNDPPATPQVPRSVDYQGGDLAGVTAKLRDGYFRDRGIRALWITPWYTQPAAGSKYRDQSGQYWVTGYHGYWPTRAREVDPRLGGAAALRELVAEAHKQGVRVVMDAVLNHVHEDHEYFKDPQKRPWFRTGCVCGTAGCDWTEKRLSCLFATYLRQTVETDHHAWLPSMNMRWEIDKDMVGRLSLSKTLGRPNYNELAAAVSLNNTLLTGSSGNPYLKPTTSRNFDASLAYYFGRRAYLSGGIFHQAIKDYVKPGNSNVEFFNTSTGTNSIYLVTSRVQVDAKLRGFEIAGETPLGNGFGVLANATYVDAKDADGLPFLGTSRGTYNLQGYYEDDKLSARLAWNYRTDYAIALVTKPGQVAAAGTHQYVGAGSASASINYKLTPNISVALDGNNLTNYVRHTYFINESAPGYWHEFGRQFYLTLRAKF